MSIRTPSELTNAAVKYFEERKFGNIFLITGIKVNSKNKKLSRTSLNDFATHPYHHGFLTAIDSIVHTHNHFRNYLKNSINNDIESLEFVFSSTITEGFQKLGATNPVCWIHIGHGDVDERLITPDDEFEDEWVEDVPMLSDGSEEDNFIDTADICKIIEEKEGEILFCALPLCFSKQNGDELEVPGKISLIHGIYNGGVNSMNEFSDGETENERAKSIFDSWSEWVNAMHTATRGY